MSASALTDRTSGAMVVVVFAGLTATCDSPATTLPTTPSAPVVVGVEIGGPSSVPPAQSAQFTAMLHLSNGATRQGGSADVQWRSSNSTKLQVNADGLVTAGADVGEANLTASVQVPSGQGSVARWATREVVVVPDGTYRLVGLVSDSDFPAASVVGARVEIAGGVSAVTGSDGRYRLYGVPQETDIQVTKAGYQPRVQHVQLATHATQNFVLDLAGERLNLAGSYTLTIEVGGCSGSRPLSDDLRRRTYQAVATQSGPTVEVTLTEPRFSVNAAGSGNRFTGRVVPEGAIFTLQRLGSYYYYYSYPDVVERLPGGTYFVPSGTAFTTGSRAGLSGTMSGTLVHYDAGFPVVAFSALGFCSSTGHPFSLTPR